MEGLDIRSAELEGRPVIMSQDSKPFNPEEVRVIMASLQQPAVFLNMVSDWPALKWNVEYLSHVLNGKPLKFRIGERKITKVPQFETHCGYVQATLQEFLVWLHGESDVSAGPFNSFPRSQYWAYADYKYIAMTLEEKAELFQEVIWSDFGFPGRDGRDSTLWIGSEAANTPCHLDSYGCNLVLQVQGRKRWHLFPPEDTTYLYSTRIPYEESSIFSSVNVVNPDLERFPRFRAARLHAVTLHPGEAAVTSHETNLHYVNLAVQACLDKPNFVKGRNPSARGLSSFSKKRKCDSGEGAEHSATTDAVRNLAEPKSILTTSIPFGPNLVPVGREAAAAVQHRVSSIPGDNSLTNNLEANHCSGRMDCNSKPTGVHRTAISTDELLNCLVHPDVISLMTEILLDRHCSH
ncbi:HSPB1-associated protein 1 homolog isoform X5 [Heterodontus francisci]|uniref:HSPB1-associated protein 1 homolog isoform X5 n=1 Tax=Heterodontus francisci TaxID=7792 RepID=UPI00355B781C